MWSEGHLPQVLNPQERGLNNYVQRQFHEYFVQVFQSIETRGKTLLEIGCARSTTLPYFAKEFGFEVSGVDYSEIGCQVARTILEKENVQGHVYCENFFMPTNILKEHFDVIVSFGVVEHFDDTTKCISAFCNFLKPGGLMITNIPNLSGMLGSFQKILDREIYDIHIPLNREELKFAHEICGLEMISCDYFMILNLSVLNIEKQKDKLWYTPMVRLRSWISKSIWLMESIVPIFPTNRFTSPYISCVARKPCA